MFLCKNGDVKIGGFCEPPSLRELDRRSIAHLDYMAPEQAMGPGNLQSDLYSVGAILWEILVATPFSVENVARVGFEADSEWREFFEQALAIDPAERAESARELRSLLAPYADPMRDKATRVMSALVHTLVAQLRDDSR